MAKNKTVYTEADVNEFINTYVENEAKRQDSFELITLMSDITGEKAKMWGPSIIGFGSYHYKYASGHEGDTPIIGFSPRKSALSLYVYSDTEKSKLLLTDLGKFKMGKACIYVKKLSDINISPFCANCAKTQSNMSASITYVLAKQNNICHGIIS